MRVIDDAVVHLRGTSANQNVRPPAELAPQGLLAEVVLRIPQRKVE